MIYFSYYIITFKQPTSEGQQKRDNISISKKLHYPASIHKNKPFTNEHNTSVSLSVLIILMVISFELFGL